jgi:hypothetical protein
MITSVSGLDIDMLPIYCMCICTLHYINKPLVHMPIPVTPVYLHGFGFITIQNR